MIFLLLCVFAVRAEDMAGNIPVTVKAGIDKETVSIGDRIKYTIEVKTVKDTEIEFPDFGENLAEFAIRDFGSSEGGFFGSKTVTQWYDLDIYETGKFTIPSTVIKYRKSGTGPWEETMVDAVGVEVLSVLDESAEKADIRDIKGPVSLFNMAHVYVLLAIAAVIIFTALIVVFLKKRKKSKKIIATPIPAHEIAYEALRELMKRDYLKTGKVREYYFELSNIVRHYIEERFQLKAPEMTTEEFLTNLKRSEALNTAQKGTMREFLSHCDMVKFARYLPDEGEIELSYESAEKLIDQTKEKSPSGERANI